MNIKQVPRGFERVAELDPRSFVVRDVEAHEAVSGGPAHLRCSFDVAVLRLEAMLRDAISDSGAETGVAILVRILVFDVACLCRRLWRGGHEHELIVVGVVECETDVGSA